MLTYQNYGRTTSTLLNSVQNNDSKTYVCESISHGLSHGNTVVITAPDVRECLKSIKLGKAAGLDGLAAEHFVYLHNIICVHCIVLYCIMRPYADGPIGPLSYWHSSGVVRNPHSALAE